MSNIVAEFIDHLLSYFGKLLIVLVRRANEGSNLGWKIEIFFIVKGLPIVKIIIANPVVISSSPPEFRDK